MARAGQSSYGLDYIYVLRNGNNVNRIKDVDKSQALPDIDLAPKLWHTKEGLRKELRQRVRSAAHQLGCKQLKQLPIEIEQIAIKHFARSQHE